MPQKSVAAFGTWKSPITAQTIAAGSKTLSSPCVVGDRAFWQDTASYIGFKDHPEAWPATFAAIVATARYTSSSLVTRDKRLHKVRRISSVSI